MTGGGLIRTYRRHQALNVLMTQWFNDSISMFQHGSGVFEHGIGDLATGEHAG